MSIPVLEVRDVTFTYAGSKKPALENINLTVDRGDFTILTGPSGCGKTTLCRIFTGLIPHFYAGKFTGDVSVFGRNTRELKIRDISRHIGFVFQNPDNQIVMTTVRREIAFSLENLGFQREEIERRVKWALSKLEILDLAEENVAHLSGGQRQRVAVAGALAVKPEILVLDEPTAYLSPSSARELFKILYKLNAEMKTTIFLIEHRLDLAIRYASKLLVMVDGRMIACGEPRDVLSREIDKISGVNIPSLVKLYHRLREFNIKSGFVPLTPEEGASMIKGILGVD